MANLTVHALLGTLNVTDGTTVEAWPASAFLRNPSGQALAPSGAPTASGTTTAGAVTLAGLSAVNYFLRIFAPSGSVTWAFVNSTRIGSADVEFVQCNPVIGGLSTKQINTSGSGGIASQEGPAGSPGATGPAGPNYTVLKKTGAYTINAMEAVEADATTGAFTITTANVTSGSSFKITKVDSSGNAVTVALPSGTINGSASIALTRQWQSVEIRTDGTNGTIN